MDNKRDVAWHQIAHRWGQTNLTETDPIGCDIEWWKNYWRQTRIQGIIVNAGGIVAYYPSGFELHYRAMALGSRDLFGEFVQAGREEGLAVLARMDINRATEEFYSRHPQWFVVDAEGVPYRADGRYFSCINSDYYKTYIPAVLREIIEHYRPDGFTDNSWTGVSRKVICHCGNCQRKFKQDTGSALPRATDWNDPAYRQWIKWSYACRMENWDLFNGITRRLGGEDCLWLGMVNANPVSAHSSFCDLKQVGERSKIVMCDHQSRDALNGFEQNSLNGSLLHGLAGWDKLIPESMANYVRGVRSFRLGSNPPLETKLWMIDGIAGGISPWYHHVGAVQEDLRQFDNAPDVMQWHMDNETYLFDRQPVAAAGLVWSQENTDFYGRDEAEEKVALPWHGFARALTRARIPFVPVHADHILREAERLRVLILPDVAVLTDRQCRELRQFVEEGGSLVFTGASATLDEWGNVRASFPLEPVTGLRHLHRIDGAVTNQTSDWAVYDSHNYFRLAEERHPILAGFEKTGIVPFGGQLHRVESNGPMLAAATYVPAFPIYPPEFSWMRAPRTDIPAVLAGEHAAGGRLVYFAGDADRCYGRTHLPDLGDLLANAVKWAADERSPLRVEGPGYLNCKLYRQHDRWIVHLVNLSGANQYPGYVEQYLPVGPIRVSVKLDGRPSPTTALLRVSGAQALPTIEDGWATVRIESLLDHELLVLE